ncbi:hypothetical protein SAMN05443637_12921 [Pseudonocardia thermophila]|jgi:hypothetical protein|uniref:Uncharacterized protein n=1 Tax=Pseudonocardia thermophila TaxID=1848 RepID=A0A1M7AP54_PSETH|nr:hypothetical protein [Pseudonocardia thermophila]SHL44477.1 hypothetical protein SAMN05443637_12921 [Pseudonocardia thermophila]
MHLIGSYPAESADEAVRAMIVGSRGRLAHLPDGETGDRRNWVVGTIVSLRDHPEPRRAP